MLEEARHNVLPLPLGFLSRTIERRPVTLVFLYFACVVAYLGVSTAVVISCLRAGDATSQTGAPESASIWAASRLFGTRSPAVETAADADSAASPTGVCSGLWVVMGWGGDNILLTVLVWAIVTSLSLGFYPALILTDAYDRRTTAFWRR